MLFLQQFVALNVTVFHSGMEGETTVSCSLDMHNKNFNHLHKNYFIPKKIHFTAVMQYIFELDVIFVLLFSTYVAPTVVRMLSYFLENKISTNKRLFLAVQIW